MGNMATGGNIFGGNRLKEYMDANAPPMNPGMAPGGINPGVNPGIIGGILGKPGGAGIEDGMKPINPVDTGMPWGKVAPKPEGGMLSPPIEGGPTPTSTSTPPNLYGAPPRILPRGRRIGRKPSGGYTVNAAQPNRLRMF